MSEYTFTIAIDMVRSICYNISNKISSLKIWLISFRHKECLDNCFFGEPSEGECAMERKSVLVVSLGLMLLLILAAYVASVTSCSAKKEAKVEPPAKTDASSPANLPASNETEEMKKIVAEVKDAANKASAASEKSANAISQLTVAVNKLVDSGPASTPSPTPKATVPAYVQTSDLIADMASNSREAAFDAACRLKRRPEAMKELVEAYASGDSTTKARVAWIINKMGEPARQWVDDVLANPASYRPNLVLTVKEILVRGDIGFSSTKNVAQDDEAKGLAAAERARKLAEADRSVAEQEVREAFANAQAAMRGNNNDLRKANTDLTRDARMAIEGHRGLTRQITQQKERIDSLEGEQVKLRTDLNKCRDALKKICPNLTL